jgi:methylated-DNA-[protein]-cysteine S-methyltransferase
MTTSTQVHSSVGPFVLEADDGRLTRLGFGESALKEGETGPLKAAVAQLHEYLDGARTEFDVDIDLSGTPFERRVWTEVRSIPYGQTATYADVAERIGSPNASRAVGRANARNPIAVIVPCHRVVGSDGSLTGYAGGLELKRTLLDLEQRARS